MGYTGVRMETNERAVEELAKKLGARLLMKGLKLATAESCTGGWIAKVLTDIAGSSDWFDCAIISYSNEAKKHFLKVPDGVLLDHGAVSENTVIAMQQEIQNLANSAATHQATRLVAQEPNRIPTYTIEIDIIEKQKRIYYFSERMARTVLAPDERIPLEASAEMA